ncbi:MAG: hypothetical protein JRN06_01950 [Nitrososphaerota archaeon]|nr:hypothetical protein [Nitrososphaerota archaeon]MDG7023382.1 hypothetical protein [Nitrososphaerota archaeon]
MKSLGMTYTMGNPGTSVSSSYIGTLDNLCIYESNGYPSLSFITYAGYPPLTSPSLPTACRSTPTSSPARP